MAAATPDLALDARALLGEGAIWNDAIRRLHWIDIEAHRVFTFDPATGENRACNVGQRIGTVVPRARGGLMLALQDGFASLDLETGRVTPPLRPPEHDPAVVRFNDGKCDPAGRFWAGTIALRKGSKPLGRLYRLDADGSVRVMLHDVGNSNGIAWSLDRRTVYYIDTPLLRVDAFDYDNATGAIANRRAIISIPPGLGRPDGSTLDAEGMLWIALWDGWGVTRWNPQTGELLQTIRLPVARVTSCAFGGQDLGTLYITSARNGLTDEQLAAQPLAGGLFKVKPGVVGMRAFAYRG
ncbi:MAG TPA: SMP-30/gluconolactonase/LRE family protein [Opitutaceae bacterium]|nr:SMP-30/gluconolactonase/LRE family protein [Opitutaceae bacterium]